MSSTFGLTRTATPRTLTVAGGWAVAYTATTVRGTVTVTAWMTDPFGATTGTLVLPVLRRDPGTARTFTAKAGTRAARFVCGTASTLRRSTVPAATYSSVEAYVTHCATDAVYSLRHQSAHSVGR